jgi:hypothetical protein
MGQWGTKFRCGLHFASRQATMEERREHVMSFNTATVLPKGQIFPPTGSKVALDCEDNGEMNPAIRAMKRLQKEMEGEWEKAGIYSEEDLMELMRKIRAEVEAEYENFH